MWGVVVACCALPLGWMLVQVAREPAHFGNLIPTRFYLGLLARTLAYGVAVAVLATLLALPAAMALGRGRGKFAAALWFMLPVALLMPSITYAYGWSQFLRLAGEPVGAWLTPLVAKSPGFASVLNGAGVTVGTVNGVPVASLELAGPADVARCVWTLATWLWPIPAGLLALALRRVDADVQQQALLDGGLARLTARQLAGPAAAAMACVVVLASQEFAVYEPTGISVVATEVRMVFETGAFSGADNPITATFISGGAAPAADSANGTVSVMRTQGFQSLGLVDQNARAGAAVATSLPLLLIAALIGVAGIVAVARLSGAADHIETGPWPRALDAGWGMCALAVLVVLVTLALPTAAMLASLKIHRSPLTIWRQFSPQATGSIVLALGAGAVAAAVAFAGAVRRTRGALALSLAAFLIGGQLLAIALIRLYNRPAPWPLDLFQLGAHAGGGGGNQRDLFDLIYNGMPIVVMAYLARFGWLALLAGNFTRTRPWRQVRELLALDGATPAQAARYVVWPLAWPMLAASALLVGVLALTEVPATVLISPLRPQPLVPMLMGWVHMLRYDDMIEGSLLLMAMALVLALTAAGLIALGVRKVKSQKSKVKSAGQSPSAGLLLLTFAFLLLTSSSPGCSDSTEPEEIWLETGTAPGQVVYPRAITYAPKDDSFFIVDRLARIQHLDARGQPLGGWQMPEWRIGKPVGLSVGPDGNVYVPDTHYDRVVVYTPEGKEVRRWGSRGTEPGQFIWPTDVAFDGAGNVYVSEYGDNDRIQVFTPDGTFLRAFGEFGNGDGQFSRPQSMVIDGGLVYITDACNHRLVVFTTDGTWVRNMGEIGSGLGQFRFPFGLEEDKQGRLIVCEFGNSRLQLIDKETGQGLAAWGAPGRDPGQLAYPWAVALDRAGRVVAVDSGNNRVQVFEF